MDLFNNEFLLTMSRVNKEIFRLANKDIEKLNLTVLQLFVLHTISKNPEIGLNELAEHLNLSKSKSTVSGVVDRLVNQNLLDRVASQKDRRAIVLRLTEQGKEKLQDYMNSESILSHKLNVIEENYHDELQQVIKFHNKILEILTSEEE
ncbi:MarR family transcriptional regulator [Bacillus ginsengihumi]|uniref:MarR family transcriptional regulator n=2 Tax=Heyndrickxia ginsengihumi TaxID=363870 RepID=A0A6M0P6Y9_9BACI|nr:MarR family transcriptional regulator [Heyndrickxia ginsengihumi]MBE6184818.1 MarR family transcriptional regulator [Bacillus sp. (in: firmicutes)]MCM3021849.1 MarR family transcriptional regulator [Heyndrickxia ginsengihumi]NEY20464.1 MarR family transcriptional regulator [Heyndrickxia ginsengihumi]